VYEDRIRVVGKGNKERIVYLNEACKKSIENYKKVRPNDKIKDKNALFISRQHNRISVKTVQLIVNKYLKMAGLGELGCSVHKLRHTAATLMYQYGQVDIRALQELLGHESISTTEIYTHVSNNQVRDAVERNPLANL
jgi:site-specific recombinase XerD